MICDNISVNADGHVTFGGQDTLTLAAKYSTPLYLLDEDRIRHNCRIYAVAMKKYFGDNSYALYAGKANCFKKMYAVIADENMGADVVSSGEIYTALKAGFPMEKTFFHSNNKTDDDVMFAIRSGVGYFVADNIEELDAIERIASSENVVQNVLLRLTPGIDPHTFAAVSTGKVDSKFGAAIETGQAMTLASYALTLSHVSLRGFHCHVGSQVFDSDVYIRSAEIMLDFIAEVKKKFGYTAEILDLGGGYGVRYTEDNPHIDIDANIRSVANAMKSHCSMLGISMPDVLMEPGRSIVADAGMTLYTVGTVKKIPGYKNYVSIDGGMTDNPRYALYKSQYTVLSAGKAGEECDFMCSLVGRCCESGDIIQENIRLPRSTGRGDIIAVLTTGAYNYSMSSNYNRLGKAPVVMLSEGRDSLAIKGETLDDIIRNDI